MIQAVQREGGVVVAVPAQHTTTQCNVCEGMSVWDQELLEILLLKPDAIRTMAETIREEHLGSDACRRVFSAARSLASAGNTSGRGTGASPTRLFDPRRCLAAAPVVDAPGPSVDDN